MANLCKVVTALSALALLAGCGIDAGGRVGPYGARAGIGTTVNAAPTPVPSGGPVLPPPLPE